MPAVQSMVSSSYRCIRQNNEIDLFEEYFTGETPELSSESISTKTLMIFKDPNPVKRAITKITWHPDNQDPRVAVSYAMLRFQQMPKGMPTMSYIWNLNNPNFPETTINPSSPLCTIAFNPKNSDTFFAGCYNGSLARFDIRKGGTKGVQPTESTILEKSHHDPVYDVYNLTHVKGGYEWASTSTDGRVLWWDNRNFTVPVDSILMEEKF